MIKKNFILGMFFLIAILLISVIFAYTDSNPQLIQFITQNSSTSGNICKEGTDFLVQITPLGCTPAVVRSDLLEEQNVPVYCQLAATQINPLIDVSAINSISFKGTYPNMISGVSFHPAKAALSVGADLNSPILNNIGYVVITLKQQKNESSMPNFVLGNLTANLKYDIKKTLGIGTAGFYLPELTDDAWQVKYSQYSFWNRRGYLRAENIGNDEARISMYDKNLKLISGTTLKKGETSGKINFPGFDCLAGFNLKLESLQNPGTRARLRINADVVEAADEESFFDNKCTIKNLNKKGIIQKAEIYCREDANGFYKGKPFVLEITPNVVLKINNQDRKVGLGDYLYDSGDKSVYLAYIGTNKDSTKKEDLFVYLVAIPDKKEKLSEDELASVSDLVSKLIYAEKSSVGILNVAENVLEKITGIGIATAKFLQGQQMLRVNYNKDNKAVTIAGNEIIVLNYVAPKDTSITNQNILENLNNAIEDYQQISDSLAQEKYPETEKETLGETALYNHIWLLYDLQQRKTMADLCSQFRQDYPDSNKNLDICDDAYKISNSKVSTAYILINGKTTQISFDGIYEPSIDEYSAEILVKGPNGQEKQYMLTLNEVQQITGLRTETVNEFIQLISLEENLATLKINIAEKGLKAFLTSDNKKLTKDSPETFGSEYTFTLKTIKLKKSAKVSLIPSVSVTGSQADFQFKIGIEKRWNVTLAPDMIKRTIEILNKSIGTWENISTGLGKFVEAEKTACLATGAVLIVKNFMEAFSGEAIARQTVMRAVGGWYDICSEAGNLDKCLSDNSNKIDKDVAELTKLRNNQNTEYTNLQKGFIKSNNLLGETSVNEDGLISSYSQQVGDDINNLEGKWDDIKISDIKTILNPKNVDAETLKNIELYNNVLKSGTASDELKALAEKNLHSELLNLQVAYGNLVTRTNAASTLNVQPEDILTYQNDKTKFFSYTRKTNKDIGGRISDTGIDGNTPVQLIEYNGQVYIVALEEQGKGNNLPIKRKMIENPSGSFGYEYDIYDITGRKISILGNNIDDLDLRNVYFKKLDTKSYQHKYLNPEIRFYQSEPYKGMPAVVPFDINNGWYAAVKPTLPVLGNIRSFDESGRVSSYWLCNVGENGKEENIGGDDICQQINLGTGQPDNVFNGLDATEAQRRISAGAEAIQKAASQANNKKINLNAGYGNIILDVGRAAADIPIIQCQDFMSPRECQILFNVCDPVICPSSRCDLGGAYPVQDVVQSGIIGSIALCMPNFVGLGGDVILPVCLTGIKAGIDGFLSVEKSYRDCLQNSLDTGQVMGICDEIHSLYLCDFFWKQMIPFAKVVLPNLISSILGHVRGGGEYLAVNSAFDNAGKSLNYFVQYYGSNVGKAFLFRTAEEFIGDAICKTYSSAVYPNGADVLSSLTKPSSPAQFTGRFDEIPFTTVTVPPISQYKVFYHIYAGNDAGAYYQVYLKATEGFYQDTSTTHLVASGFAPAREYASETKDFTAPSGYKQLCINVNGQEECGFQQVSTSFAVDYIEEKYLETQAGQKVTSEKECTSGDISSYLVGSLYNKGIIRICATDNPGKGTDPYTGTESQRWIDVGYCGEQNIRCWIDTQSVKNVIDIGTIENDTLSKINENYQNVLSKEGYLTNEKFLSLVEQLKREKDPNKRINLATENLGKIFFNNQRAYVLLWRGDAYAELARRLFADYLKNLVPQPATTTTTTAIKTYVIEQIGFKKNDESAVFDSDVKKIASDTIILSVVPENNCEKEEYQIFLDKKVLFGDARERISRLFGGNFNPDEPVSGRIDLSSANALLKNLAVGTYSVSVYCFDLSGNSKLTSSKNKLIVKEGSAVGTLSTLAERYTKLKGLFETYSKSPYTPTGWNPKAFESLLLAIATRQSNLGYPNGVYDPRWVMEYGWLNGARIEKYKCEFTSPTENQMSVCADTQIKDAAVTLRDAINKDEAKEVINYKECNDIQRTDNGENPKENDFLRCVVSVYMTGIKDTTSTQGKIAAEEVIDLMLVWREYLNSNEDSDILTRFSTFDI